MKRLCIKFGFETRIVNINYDSENTIYLVNNPMYHAHTKNIDVQYYFIQKMIKDRRVQIEKVGTLLNIIDSLTKIVSNDKFQWSREAMELSLLRNKFAL